MTMTLDALFVFIILVGSVLAVSREWLSLDIALMSALGLVTIGGLLEPGEAVEGFAHTAVVALASLYILAAAARKFDLARTIGGAVGRGTRRLPAPLDDIVRRTSSMLDRESEVEVDADGSADHRGKEWLFAAILAAVVALPLTGVLRFESAVLAGAVATTLAGLVTPEQARRAVNWQIVLAVGAIFGLSRAVVESGLIDMLAADAQFAFGSSLSIALLSTTALVVAALSNRRAVTSLLPVTLTSALFLASGLGL